MLCMTAGLLYQRIFISAVCSQVLALNYIDLLALSVCNCSKQLSSMIVSDYVTTTSRQGYACAAV